MSLQGKRFLHWNYRVVESSIPNPDGTAVYGIHEMYYDGDGHGWWTTEPVTVTACSVDELRVQLDQMLTALELDVIVDD